MTDQKKQKQSGLSRDAAAVTPIDVASTPGKHGTYIPLLDSCWMERIEFMPYTRPGVLADEADVDQRADVLSIQIADVHRLLSLPYHVFWSHALHDKSLDAFLTSFLNLAPRPHDLPLGAPLPERLQTMETTLARKVFLVYLRLSTHKEAPDRLLTERGFSKLIYNHWIFDVPKMFDLCALFASSNAALLSKMVGNVFSRQPAYFEDLYTSLVAVSTLIHRTCLQHRAEGLPAEVPVHDRSPAIPKPRFVSSLSVQEAVDLGAFVHDVAATLRCFVSMFPACRQRLRDARLLIALCCLHTSIVDPLLAATRAADDDAAAAGEGGDRGKEADAPSGKGDGKALLAQACAVAAERALLACIVTVVDDAFVQPLLPTRQPAHEGGDDAVPTGREGDEDEEDPSLLDTAGDREDAVFEALDALVLYPTVATWLSQEQALASVFSSLAHAGVDGTRLSFYQQLLASGEGTVDPAVLAEVESRTTAREDADGGGRGDANKRDAALEAEVDQVLAVIPDLGRGFVKACLRACKRNAESVINRVFEGNLPPSVVDLPRDLSDQDGVPASGGSSSKKKQLTDGHGAKRKREVKQQQRSIYDGDEFDIMSGAKLDPSRVHRGKQPQMDAAHLVHDEDGRATAKAFLQRSVAHEQKLREEARSGKARRSDRAIRRELETLSSFMYEDEYDDTYDALETVGSLEPEEEDNADPPTIYNPNRGRTFKPPHTAYDRDDDDDDDGDGDGDGRDEENGSGHGNGEFTAPPQGRPFEGPSPHGKARGSDRGRSRGRGRGRGGRGGRESTFKPTDVAAPRGRGGRSTGEKATRGRGAVSKPWLARRHKESNKAKHGNHNRKARAMKKQTQGIPQ